MRIHFLLGFLLSHLVGFGQPLYVCPPCHSECDARQFSAHGNCQTCGMKLMLLEDRLQTEEFSFKYDNVLYSAEISLPGEKETNTVIVIVPGHGQTDFVGGGQYYELRQFFSRMGFATLVWDKKGCGKSGGEYEHHQSVQSSASETLAAVGEFKRLKGANFHVGLWGISRGGWICPLVINEDPSIAFWISLSGTDQFDNFRYSLETNLRIEGRSTSEIDTLLKQFDYYVKSLRQGGVSYAQLVHATEKLFSDPYYISLGEKRVTESEFLAAPEYYKTSGDIFDEKTGLRVLVANFENTLMKLNCPVLGIFGELDSQVDWRKTNKLYQKTIGKNSKNLKTVILPKCNHNIMTCNSGGVHEDLGAYQGKPCDGYYPAMQAWLIEKGFTKN